MKLAAYVLLLSTASLFAQSDSLKPRVLIVTAHPDDETSMAATVWKITHDLGGTVDLALVTNAEGGYKYSTLGNYIYGHELTDEDTGRALLPAIRKRELMNGGEIIGIRNYWFLDQQDHRFTLNVDSTFGYVWDTAYVARRLAEIIEEGEYDYVFGLLPTEETHGHHKGATIMALTAASRLPIKDRPVVLGVSGRQKADTLRPFKGLAGFPLTAVVSGSPSFSFDRTQKFGYKDQLDYRIIVNWLIAEHKSQGTMQLGVNQGELEQFWWFDANDRARYRDAERLFARLAENRFEKLEY